MAKATKYKFLNFDFMVTKLQFKGVLLNASVCSEIRNLSRFTKLFLLSRVRRGDILNFSELIVNILLLLLLLNQLLI